jgi:hypothetical protein
LIADAQSIERGKPDGLYNNPRPQRLRVAPLIESNDAMARLRQKRGHGQTRHAAACNADLQAPRPFFFAPSLSENRLTLFGDRALVNQKLFIFMNKALSARRHDAAMQVTSVSEMAALFRQRAQMAFEQHYSALRAETRRVPEITYGTRVFESITGATGAGTDPCNAANRVRDDTRGSLIDLIV